MVNSLYHHSCAVQAHAIKCSIRKSEAEGRSANSASALYNYVAGPFASSSSAPLSPGGRHGDPGNKQQRHQLHNSRESAYQDRDRNWQWTNGLGDRSGEGRDL